MERHEILQYAVRLAESQPGGTLATTHEVTGASYITYVLAHLCADGRLLFGSGLARQHSKNILASPPVSFLFDSRSAVASDWTAFDRVSIDGDALVLPPGHPHYERLLSQIAAKSPMAAYFTRHGVLFSVEPRRLTLSRGLDPNRHIVQFPPPVP